MANEAQKEAAGDAFAPRKDAAAQLDTVAEITNLSRAVKIIEDKYSNLRKKVQLDEQNSLAAQKKLFDEVRVTNSDLLDLKREVEDIKEKILQIIKELKGTAKSEQFEELQKYIEFWEPMNFVTRAEIKKIVEKAMEEKFS